MDKTQISTLKKGQIIYHKTLTNYDQTPRRYKITSIKTWKTRPGVYLMGLKRGLYEYHKVNEYELENLFMLDGQPNSRPVRKIPSNSYFLYDENVVE